MHYDCTSMNMRNEARRIRMHMVDMRDRNAMITSIVEQQVHNAAQELLDDKTVKILKGVRRLASKQGGENVIENYQLLGKRTLIALGITIVAVQAVSSAVSFVVSRKSEEQRLERIVRRVLDEERQKDESK